MELKTDACTHTRDFPVTHPTLSACAILVHDLGSEVDSLRNRVKNAIMHALETQKQAESQHLSHPSLVQRAHGATIANEPPGIHHVYWQLRSHVRESQHKDELALGELRSAHRELMSKELGLRRVVTVQDEEIVKEIEDLEDELERLKDEVQTLEVMVNSRWVTERS